MGKPDGDNGLDFEIGRFTRRCAGTDRDLKPGEAFYSVLMPQGTDVVRVDYSVDGWSGPPEDAICFWKSEMPTASAKRVAWAPKNAILGVFHELYEKQADADRLYVLALLLIRKRFVRLESTERDDQQREVMLLYSPEGESEYRVLVAEPSPTRVIEIQQDLEQLLFSAVQ